MIKTIFIIGGARSGKSKFGEQLSILLNKKNKNKIAYIATAEPFDQEFKNRIQLHKNQRDINIFQTYEEPLFIDNVIINNINNHNIFLIECITTWLGNIFFKIDQNEQNQFIDNIINNIFKYMNKNITDNNLCNNNLLNNKIKLKKIKIKKNNKFLIFISNETGLGIVPDNELSRRFRDQQGFLNQKLCKLSDYAFYLNCGIPIRIK